MRPQKDPNVLDMRTPDKLGQSRWIGRLLLETIFGPLLPHDCNVHRQELELGTAFVSEVLRTREKLV